MLLHKSLSSSFEVILGFFRCTRKCFNVFSAELLSPISSSFSLVFRAPFSHAADGEGEVCKVIFSWASLAALELLLAQWIP